MEHNAGSPFRRYAAKKRKNKLPFTPFHMGAALVVKPALNHRFSVISFGIAQVAMDVEPGIRMWAHADVLHGPTHTFLGALIMAFIVMLIAPGICNRLLAKWNKEVACCKQPWLAHAEPVSKLAIANGAFFGTLSHVVLDSLMHHDIRPLNPFSESNPFMSVATSDGVYQACVVAGVLGITSWFALRGIGRYRVKGERRRDA